MTVSVNGGGEGSWVVTSGMRGKERKVWPEP